MAEPHPRQLRGCEHAHEQAPQYDMNFRLCIIYVLLYLPDPLRRSLVGAAHTRTLMSPINSPKRRLQFLRFVALFLFSVLPLLLLVHAYGRVDKVENQFLREQYRQNLQVERNKEEYLDKLGKLHSAYKDLSDGLVNAASVMQSFDQVESGVVFNKVTKVQDTRTDFYNLIGSAKQPADSVLSEVVLDGLNVVTTFRSVYDAARKEIGDLQDENERLELEKIALKQELEKIRFEYPTR